MSKREIDPLRQAYGVMLGAYSRTERDGEFSAWDTWLREFPNHLLSALIMKAPDIWPEKMPNVGQMRVELQSMISKQRAEHRDSQPGPQPDQPPLAYSGREEFDGLASRWEAQSIEAGYDPDRPPPRSVAIQRMQELNQLWAAVPDKAIDGPINPNPRERKRIPR
jgi:hypothetical protein